MTRMQEMSLDYHFTVEQEVGSSTYSFFGFNGTASLWRIAALEEAGGWKDRTTVEDMDLAVRASLKGWKFLYLGNLKVKNELPSTFKAYCYQQHRWSCGPANLFRKMVMEIIRNKRVTLWKKVHVIYSFFFVRKIIAHIVTFVLYCIVLSTTVLVPKVEVPKWGAVYIPSIITLLNSVGTPRSGFRGVTLPAKKGDEITHNGDKSEDSLKDERKDDKEDDGEDDEEYKRENEGQDEEDG